MSQNHPSGNPCGCVTGQPVTINDPTTYQNCLDCEDCFIVTSPLLLAADGVGPCGKTGTLDVSTANNYDKCATGVPVYKIVNFDTAGFVSATIDQNGIITYVTADSAEAKHYYQIVYRVTCSVEQYGGYGIATIGMKDLCQAVACAEGEKCDPCSGDCVDINADLEVDVQTPGGGEGISVTRTIIS